MISESVLLQLVRSTSYGLLIPIVTIESRAHRIALSILMLLLWQMLRTLHEREVRRAMINEYRRRLQAALCESAYVAAGRAATAANRWRQK
jgi:hypothetical protein